MEYSLAIFGEALDRTGQLALLGLSIAAALAVGFLG